MLNFVSTSNASHESTERHIFKYKCLEWSRYLDLFLCFPIGMNVRECAKKREKMWEIKMFVSGKEEVVRKQEGKSHDICGCYSDRVIVWLWMLINITKVTQIHNHTSWSRQQCSCFCSRQGKIIACVKKKNRAFYSHLSSRKNRLAVKWWKCLLAAVNSLA